jgi:hypothetical protein
VLTASTILVMCVHAAEPVREDRQLSSEELSSEEPEVRFFSTALRLASTR